MYPCSHWQSSSIQFPQPLVTSVWVYTSVRSMFYILHMDNIMEDLLSLDLLISVDPSSSDVLLKKWQDFILCVINNIPLDFFFFPLDFCTKFPPSTHLSLSTCSDSIVLLFQYSCNKCKNVPLFSLWDMQRDWCTWKFIFNFLGISIQFSIVSGWIYIPIHQIIL